ncbi:hypothetical protein DACRYDRAFT_107017 [Dacryopinax primogenitus]|uniref:Chromo domain-containing protein n=1 Tax=Dacryopinax primogenitus (strain DJM 731) TaxID=1858805 RepID=M5G1I2_DACPD|nr:uncharacterized protein DACRYDRAFT_107017 [Dacryopinax primogenitus]EJU02070.1 hypothetical protein DACRYDRAFT_107017 [Dacryopinax primogenitus]
MQEGDKVWLDLRNIQTTWPTKKLDDKWFGPFEIKLQVNLNAYRLKLLKHFLVHPVFHVSKLQRYFPNDIKGQTVMKPPPPIIHKDTLRSFEVEQIEDSKFQYAKLYYRVKWKGYPSSESTWEPKDNLCGAAWPIREFHQQYPEAPQQLSATDFAQLLFHPLENFTKLPKQVLFNWTEGRAN